MPFCSFHHPKTLPGWLAIATEDLVRSGRRRIRTEIEAHFAEAVQAHLVKGLPEAEARSAALADLGDPRTAARRLCREYLTIAEARQVVESTASAQSISRLFLFIFIVLPVLGTAIQEWPGASNQMFLKGSIVGCLLFSFIILARSSTFFLARGPTNLRVHRRTVLLNCITQLGIGLMILLNWVAPTFSRHLPLMAFLLGLLAVILAILVVGVVSCSRLRRKLAAANEDDLPPRQPFAA